MAHSSVSVASAPEEHCCLFVPHIRDALMEHRNLTLLGREKPKLQIQKQGPSAISPALSSVIQIKLMCYLRMALPTRWLSFGISTAGTGLDLCFRI